MKVVIGFVLVIAIALGSVWPMLQNPSRVADFGSDGVLLIWIMNQPQLFNGNIFYPYNNTLAYSDRLLLSRFATRLPVLLSANPAVAFGFALVWGQVLTMGIIYLIWVVKFRNPYAATIAATAFGLSQIRFEYQVHLQMWGMQYWLLALLLWIHKPNKFKTYLGFVLLGLQFWESPLPVYFALTCLIFIRPKFDRHFLFGLALAVLIIAPLAKVYLGVSREFGVHRSIREAAHNSISVDDLWGYFASPGLYLLFALVLIKRPKKMAALWGLLLISLLLAFGPALKWHGQTVKILHLPIPGPYAPTYYLMPGFKALRTPSRWLLLSGFAASGLIAATLSRHKLATKDLVFGLAAAIAGGTFVYLVRDIPAPQQYPLVYRWLKSQPGKIVLELPIYTWPQEKTETYRMLYNLESGKTLVNGFSGFTPPMLRANLDYIVVHHDEGAIDKIEGQLVWQDETTSVYFMH